jgi:hypothetical protein
VPRRLQPPLAGKVAEQGMVRRLEYAVMLLRGLG